MSMFRKAYSVFGALLMLQVFLQLYFIAGAIFTIVNANDNPKDIYAAFKHADSFASLHVANGYLIGFTILIMVALSVASRYPWRTTIMTAVLWVLVAVQSVLAHTPLAALAGAAWHQRAPHHRPGRLFDWNELGLRSPCVGNRRRNRSFAQDLTFPRRHHRQIIGRLSDVDVNFPNS